MRALCAWLRPLWIVGLLLTVATVSVPLARADELDDETRRIARQLRCPICESVSVADSPAELAVQMRALIRKKLEAGESEQQIVSYFVQAYGDSVLLEPPRRGLGWMLWIGPLVALFGGSIVLAWLLRGWVAARRKSAQPPRSPVCDRQGDPDGAGAEELARQELEAVRRGLAR